MCAQGSKHQNYFLNFYICSKIETGNCFSYQNRLISFFYISCVAYGGRSHFRKKENFVSHEKSRKEIYISNFQVLLMRLILI